MSRCGINEKSRFSLEFVVYYKVIKTVKHQVLQKKTLLILSTQFKYLRDVKNIVKIH